MVNSQNGWPANRRDLVSSRLIPGTKVRLTVRTGPPGDLLLEVASLFDLLVQDVDNATGVLDDWGYAERNVRGSSSVSNHASGTAIDLNATRWSLGQSASVNLNPKQIGTVREIVAAAGGVVRWGGDYTGRKDPMHFEINDRRTEADCTAALAALRRRYGSRSNLAAPAPAPAPLHREDDLAMRIDICPDEHGYFHEVATFDGGNTVYVAQSHLLLSTTFGRARFSVTARDHQGGGPLYQWPVFDLPDNGFAAIALDPKTRILVVEGDIEHLTNVYDQAGSLTQRATRPAATVQLKAA